MHHWVFTTALVFLKREKSKRNAVAVLVPFSAFHLTFSLPFLFIYHYSPLHTRVTWQECGFCPQHVKNSIFPRKESTSCIFLLIRAATLLNFKCFWYLLLWLEWRVLFYFLLALLLLFCNQNDGNGNDEGNNLFNTVYATQTAHLLLLSSAIRLL